MASMHVNEKKKIRKLGKNENTKRHGVNELEWIVEHTIQYINI